MHDVEGIERIRFATSHPRYFTERLIEACAELPKVCEHFHVPFQSGDDELLKAMARGYTTARYRRIVEQIRNLMPDAAISADAIVGFPGETDAQFRRTLELVEEIGFDLLNTAAYSPGPTPQPPTGLIRWKTSRWSASSSMPWWSAPKPAASAILGRVERSWPKASTPKTTRN